MPTRVENPGVHSVRFWAVISIISIHAFAEACNLIYPRGFQPSADIHLWIQPFRFSTIGFFIMSGFLLSTRLPEKQLTSYFLQRVRNLGVAWTFWFSLILIGFTFLALRRHEAVLHDLRSPRWIYNTTFSALNGTSFWFIPCLLLSMACLLPLRGHRDKAWVGAALCFITVFFGINQHLQVSWLPTEHTKSVVGFVFYLWLGFWWGRHVEKVDGWIKWLGLWGTLALIAVTFVMSVMEGRHIALVHNGDPVDNLRITNGLFAISMVLGLMRLQRRTWPKFVNVGSYTFGVVLMHIPLLFLFTNLLHHIVHLPPTLPSLAFLWVLLSTLCPLVAFPLVHFLSRSRYGWWVVTPHKPKREIKEKVFAPANIALDANAPK